MKHFLRMVIAAGAIASLAVLAGCSGGGEGSPTSNRTAMVTGTVVVVSSSQAVIRPGAAGGAAGIVVRVDPSGASATTDASGRFTLSGVPAGDVTLDFDRSDLHARGQIMVPGGSVLAVAVTISGGHASISAGGHPGDEIEGRVQSVDAAAGSLVVADQRLGNVTVTTSDTTSIRRGAMTLTLAQIAVGMSVHVKATLQGDGTYLATEILVQDLSLGGSTTANGTIGTIDSGAGSLTLNTPSGTVTVTTSASTIIRKEGKAAAFSDLAAGARVQVTGTVQTDGSIAAAEIDITG
jgi:hypothetical protein